MRHRIPLIFIALLCLLCPVWAQIERVNDASLLLRAASFGSTIGTTTSYVLAETQPDHWVVYAENGPASSVNWVVKEAPMGGANAGYVVFVNGENETMTLDVLQIDACYGTTGEIRIGW